MTTPNDRLKILRETLGLKVTAFARVIAYSQGTISTIEAGKSSVEPRLVRVLNFAFGVNEDWLLNGTGGEDPVFDSRPIKIDYPDLEVTYRFLRETIDSLTPDRRAIVLELVKRLAGEGDVIPIPEKKNDTRDIEIPIRKVS